MINKEIHYFSDPLTLLNGIIVELSSGEYSFVREGTLSSTRFSSEEEALAGLNAENVQAAKLCIPFSAQIPSDQSLFRTPHFAIYQHISYPVFEEQALDSFLKDDLVVGIYQDENGNEHPYIGMIDEPFMQQGEAVSLVDVWVWLDGFTHSTDQFLCELRQCSRISSPVQTLRDYIDYALDTHQPAYFDFLTNELRKFIC